MSAYLFLLLVVAPRTTVVQDPLDEARRLRTAGRYAEALELTADILDPVQRAFERLEVRYHAGDLGGALREALAGLEVAPADRMLLWRASRLAIDLLATERAVVLSERLRAVVESGSDLAPADRQAWVQEASELTQAAADVQRIDTERGNALLRARAAVVLVALGVLLAAVWLSRAPREVTATGDGGVRC